MGYYQKLSSIMIMMVVMVVTVRSGQTYDPTEKRELLTIFGDLTSYANSGGIGPLKRRLTEKYLR
jgi:hypothetical protein